MPLINDLQIKCDVNRIFSIIGVVKGSSTYERILDIYKDMYKKAYSLIELKASYKTYGREHVSRFTWDYEYFIPCSITLGESISIEIDSLFKRNKAMDAIILDYIATEVLFNASIELRNRIIDVIKNMGINLTSPIFPGEKDIPVDFNNNILNMLSGNEALGISLTDIFMLKPFKSMVYCYGAETGLNCDCDTHMCRRCEIMNCVYRNDKKIKLTINEKGISKEIYTSVGMNLLDILRENNIFISTPCNGIGKCGKCKVSILGDGFEYRVNKDAISHKELNQYLACYVYPTEDLIINIPESNSKYSIMLEHESVYETIKPRFKIVNIDKVCTNSEESKSVFSEIIENLGEKYEFNLKSIQNLSKIYKDSPINIILYDKKIIEITKKENPNIYGIAIDIGTTTLGFEIIKLLTGEKIGNYSMINKQRNYGLDVISRIQYDFQNRNGNLTQVIRESILESINNMCEKYNINLDEIYHISIVGNTTMLYFLLGIETYELATKPFKCSILEKQEYNFNEVFSDDRITCKVTILPCISAYIGADMVSNILCNNLLDKDYNALIIDIGTNGEMAIVNKDKIICTSTAAGPAFEGANIIHGMGSVEGAISKVYIEDNKILYETIGGGSPVGICGSGVIDTVAEFLENNIIDKTGRIILDEGKSYINIAKVDDKEINFYQKDIREVQLAKSAIFTGIQILLNKSNITYNDIDIVYIAGGFGNNLNIYNATKIKLIPKELENRVEYVGNSSLGGAVKYLLNKDSDDILNRIIERTEFINLGETDSFNKQFIMNMYF